MDIYTKILLELLEWLFEAQGRNPQDLMLHPELIELMALVDVDYKFGGM